MLEGKGKQPSLIMDQEITTKSGQVIMQRFGAMFQREDGSHDISFEAYPMKGASVARTPELRMERLKQLGQQKSKDKEIER
jgi:hypothetical protein